MPKRTIVFGWALLGLFLISPAAPATSQPQLKPVRNTGLVVSAADLLTGLRVIAPAAGVHWRLGTEKSVSWSADPAKVGPAVRILLLRAQQVQNASGQQAQTVLQADCASSAPSWSWKIPETQPPGEYRIVVQSTSSGRSASSQPFRLVPQPTFAIVQPASGSTWQAGQTYTVKWNYSGEAIGPLGLILFCSNGTRVDNIPLNGANNSRSWNLTVPANAGSGPAALILFEKNDEAKLENDLIGYRGVMVGLTVSH